MKKTMELKLSSRSKWDLLKLSQDDVLEFNLVKLVSISARHCYSHRYCCYAANFRFFFLAY